MRGRRARHLINEEGERAVLLLPDGTPVGGKADEDKVYESLDYDRCENSLYDHRFRHCPPSQLKALERWTWKYNLTRWVMMFIIGAATAMVAVFINIVVDKLTDLKFDTVGASITRCMHAGCQMTSLLLLLAFQVGFVSIAAGLTAMAPVAAGSGIPEIKCYLNGVKVPGVLRLKTLMAKAVGVLFSVAGGMVVGKEGPMIHSGAVIAGGLSQGKSTSLPCINAVDFSWFRNDRAKRDFVAAGAAAGVAAAFGAPIGGVLFALEEGSSFWNQSLTWRALFCAMSASFTLNLFMSGFLYGAWGQLDFPSLINFGQFRNDEGHLWTALDLVAFIIMGIVGGLLGALFNALNHRLTSFRMRHLKGRGRRFAEAILIATVFTCLVFAVTLTLGSCRPRGDAWDKDKNITRTFNCPDDEFNDLATLVFNPMEGSIRVRGDGIELELIIELELVG